ncbi:curli-like amyloid fiber formation chaperone CsgH [Roseinatronobacter sp.]
MPAHSEVLKAMVSIECDILTRAVSGGTEFSGIVRSQSHVAGDYSFTVASSGAGGSSSVIQRGLFQLGTEHEAMVGQIVIGSGARTQVTARLSIRTEYDDLVCDAVK